MTRPLTRREAIAAFDDEVTDEVFKGPEYAGRGERDTTNANDGIYADGGAESQLAVEPSGDGYVGRLTMGVQA